MLKKQNTC